MGLKPLALVVDDNASWADILEDILSAEYRVEKTHSHRDALRFIENHWQEVGLAVIDICLDGESITDNQAGLDIISILSSHNIPCIATSAFAHTPEARVVRDALVEGGALDFWFKRKQTALELIRAIQKADYRIRRRISNMATPAEQLGMAVLLESIKFLFAELGRRLEFWRKKKGGVKPQNVEDMEIKERGGEIVLRLDDVVHPINISAFRMLEGRIQTSLDILQRNYTTLDTYRKRLLTDPLITPKEEAFCKQRIPELEKTIEQEANQLQELLERALV